MQRSTPVNIEIRIDEGEIELEAAAERVREALLQHPDDIITVWCQNERQADQLSRFLTASDLERFQYLWPLEDPPKIEPRHTTLKSVVR
jgi:hypothetical protein